MALERGIRRPPRLSGRLFRLQAERAWGMVLFFLALSRRIYST
jgi:hypothetical protein